MEPFNEDPLDFTERVGREYAQLIHRVFKQTEDGQRLLKEWTEASLIYEWETSSIFDVPGLDPQRLAYKEGQRFFPKHIHSLIQVIEEE